MPPGSWHQVNPSSWEQPGTRAGWKGALTTLSERLPSGKSGSLGIRAHTTSRRSRSTRYLQQECSGLSCVNPFGEKTQQDCPLSKWISSTLKRCHPRKASRSPTPPLSSLHAAFPAAGVGTRHPGHRFQRASPREVRKQQGESKGGELYSFSPKMEMPTCTPGHCRSPGSNSQAKRRAHGKQHNTLRYFCVPFLPPHSLM